MIKILIMHLKRYTHDQDHNDPRIQMDRNQWSSPWYSYCLCSARWGESESSIQQTTSKLRQVIQVVFEATNTILQKCVIPQCSEKV